MTDFFRDIVVSLTNRLRNPFIELVLQTSGDPLRCDGLGFSLFAMHLPCCKFRDEARSGNLIDFGSGRRTRPCSRATQMTIVDQDAFGRGRLTFTVTVNHNGPKVANRSSTDVLGCGRRLEHSFQFSLIRIGDRV